MYTDTNTNRNNMGNRNSTNMNANTLPALRMNVPNTNANIVTPLDNIGPLQTAENDDMSQIVNAQTYSDVDNTGNTIGITDNDSMQIAPLPSQRATFPYPVFASKRRVLEVRSGKYDTSIQAKMLGVY